VDDINKQLKKGVLEILILKLLTLRDMYGYQLIQELDEASHGVFRMKEGSLYPVLYRLEDDQFIESYWEQVNDRRSVPRKYYRITARGIAEYKRALDELKRFITGIYAILDLGGK
jgi:PadR family transcriptional regulator PadR